MFPTPLAGAPDTVRRHGRPVASLAACAVAAMLAVQAGPAGAGNISFRATYVPKLFDASTPEQSNAWALNDSGDLVGSAINLSTGLSQGYLFSDGRMIALGTGPASGGVATAVNNRSGATGQVTVVGMEGNRSFLQTVGTLTGQAATATRFGLGAVFQFTQAWGVNASGTVVGTVAQDSPGHGPILAYMLPQLGQPPVTLWGSSNFGTGTDGRAINDKGTVVGSRVDDLGDRRATAWDNGSPRDLGVLGTDPAGNFSQALAINNQGWVVGESNLTAGNPRRYAFLVNGSGTMQRLAANLDTNAGTSAATGINAFFQVVGQFTNGSNTPGGFGLFLDSPGNGSVDLRPLIVGLRAGDAGVVKAGGINAVGQIAATSYGGAVLLSPEGTLTWARLAGGNLADAANWDSGLGFAPNRLLDVVMASRASQTLTLDTDLQAKSLTVGAAPGGNAGGRIRLQLANGALVQPGSGLTVLGSGTLAGDGRVAGVVINRGTVLATADTTLRLDGGLDNHGLVTGNGRIDAELINRGDGQGVRAGAGQSLTLAGAVHTNGDGAAIQVSGGGELRFVGNLTNQGGAVVQLNRATLRLDGGLVNAGQVQISFGGAEVFGEVANHRAGRIIASGGSQTTFWDRLVNDGEVRASGGAQIVYFGAVSGSGDFNTSGDGSSHRFEGGYLPGNSPADVQVGDVQFASTLTMEIGGLAPGSGHDRIRFAGSVLFDTGSALDVHLLGGWQPQAGDHYQLFAFSQAPQGSFADLWLPTLAPGLQWDSTGLYTSGLLAVSGVPEPTSGWLLAAGLVGVALRRRGARPRD